ncbi:hypothetical protein JAAARDRAFT_60979 [Jaapia argillacea MUCL 33604]|uniref:Uncharacterized protein n=1 Tax=Jaapia argillacea MUCL 33604 TaxID=933084 RepID=A0A067PU72_9AGAM|nr:hypothetical protein JAAARDRAFT_60979 [Jaapia argillacea MUCL 33604]
MRLRDVNTLLIPRPHCDILPKRREPKPHVKTRFFPYWHAEDGLVPKDKSRPNNLGWATYPLSQCLVTARGISFSQSYRKVTPRRREEREGQVIGVCDDCRFGYVCQGAILAWGTETALEVVLATSQGKQSHSPRCARTSSVDPPVAKDGHPTIES